MECVSVVFMHVSVANVGIATRYGLDGPGIEFRWEVRFPGRVQNGPGYHPASYTMVIGPFTVVKPTGRGIEHAPQSSVEVKGK